MRLNESDELAFALGKMWSFTPTVDAVPVVRCKDCKCRDDKLVNGKIMCYWFYSPMSEDDYCSKAVIKDELKRGK